MNQFRGANNELFGTDMRNFYYLFKIHFISFVRLHSRAGITQKKLVFLSHSNSSRVNSISCQSHQFDWCFHVFFYVTPFVMPSLVNGGASSSRHVIQIREHEVRLSDTHTSEFFVFVIDLTIFSRDNDDNQYLNVFSVFCFTKVIQAGFGGDSMASTKLRLWETLFNHPVLQR